MGGTTNGALSTACNSALKKSLATLGKKESNCKDGRKEDGIAPSKRTLTRSTRRICCGTKNWYGVALRCNAYLYVSKGDEQHISFPCNVVQAEGTTVFFVT